MTTAARRPLWWSVVALAVAGAGISAYLTFTHLADEPLVCAGLGSCATVQSSEYAEIGGVPVALVGLLSYLAIAGLALLAPGRPAAQLGVFGLALTGVLYSGYLTWVEIAILEAVCLWCAASAVVVVLIAALAGAALFSAPAAPAPPAVARPVRLSRGG
jgi:uncharacterized membrane protein